MKLADGVQSKQVKRCLPHDHVLVQENYLIREPLGAVPGSFRSRLYYIQYMPTSYLYYNLRTHDCMLGIAAALVKDNDEPA